MHSLNESYSSRHSFVIDSNFLSKRAFQRHLSRSGISVWRRHQLIITTLSPLAKRFNQCHRANFRSPLAPVPSPSRSPLLSTASTASTASSSSSSSRARLSGRLLCRKLRGTRSKRRRKSQFISFQAGHAAGDRDSDFPPRSRLPPHSHRGPALMTLENRSLRSLAHCHSSLSHAPLIARYLSHPIRAFFFYSPPGVFDCLYARGV